MKTMTAAAETISGHPPTARADARDPPRERSLPRRSSRRDADVGGSSDGRRASLAGGERSAAFRSPGSVLRLALPARRRAWVGGSCRAGGGDGRLSRPERPAVPGCRRSRRRTRSTSSPGLEVEGLEEAAAAAAAGVGCAVGAGEGSPCGRASTTLPGLKAPHHVGTSCSGPGADPGPGVRGWRRDRAASAVRGGDTAVSLFALRQRHDTRSWY
jgi:hypothetical protein